MTFFRLKVISICQSLALSEACSNTGASKLLKPNTNKISMWIMLNHNDNCSIHGYIIRAFRGFGQVQAEFDNNAAQLKVVKIDTKIIISLCESKFMTHSVCFRHRSGQMRWRRTHRLHGRQRFALADHHVRHNLRPRDRNHDHEQIPSHQK